MTKFLRKYNKLILVVGGALLMVAFLMPQALQQLGQDQTRAEYMRIGGRKVTQGEAAQADRRLYVLRQTVPFVLMRLGIEPDRTEHWMMLTHEARRHGLIGGPQDGRDFMPDLADAMAFAFIQAQYGELAQMILESQMGQQVVDQARDQMTQSLNAARVNSGLRPEEFDNALAELRGIVRLRNLYDAGPGRVSDRRAILEGLRLLNSATVDYVFVPAAQAMDQAPTPDDAALEAQLAAYRDVRPGEGEYGIGYLLPPRVKLEWLMLDRDAIADTVRVDRVDVAQRFIRDNPGVATGGPEFEAARAQIEQAIRKETTDTIMAEADRAIRAEFARATRKLDVQGEYRVLPADWDQMRPDLQKVRDAVVERVKSQLNRTIPAPSVTTMNAAWHTAEDLAGLPRIGPSGVKRGNRTIPFAQAALSVKELGDSPIGLGLQVGVPGGMSQDAAGSQYYFTILEARPESAPESVDEIRDRLVNDYRRLEAYKVLEREAEVYRQRAVNEGLASLTTPPTPPATPPADGSTPPATPTLRTGVTVSRAADLSADPVLNAEAIRDAIVTAASGLDPTIDASTVDVAQRTIAVPAPGQLGLVVAQIQSFRPMTMEGYRQMDRGLAQQLMKPDPEATVEDPFSIERMAERLNAKLPVRRSDTES